MASLPLDLLFNGHKMVATAISIICSHNCPQRQKVGENISQIHSPMSHWTELCHMTTHKNTYLTLHFYWFRKKRSGYRITSQQSLAQQLDGIFWGPGSIRQAFQTPGFGSQTNSRPLFPSVDGLLILLFRWLRIRIRVILLLKAFSTDIFLEQSS